MQILPVHTPWIEVCISQYVSRREGGNSDVKGGIPALDAAATRCVLMGFLGPAWVLLEYTVRAVTSERASKRFHSYCRRTLALA